jgi:Zn-finger nucleic acid-binding protein
MRFPLGKARGVFMNCPTCKVELRIADRQGIEIDHCPQCRGIWLDRGELDKIIERTASEMPTERLEEYGYQRDRDSYRHGGYRKRRSFLGDLFDFD